MTSAAETPVLRILRTFDAPVERVFRAWSDPRALERRAWGSLGHDVLADVDLRVGGSYRIETSKPGKDTLAFLGTYQEIVPGRRLVYTLHWDAPMGYDAPDERVTVEFADGGAQTRVTFLHEGVPEQVARDTHETGWADTFDALDRHLMEQPA